MKKILLAAITGLVLWACNNDEVHDNSNVNFFPIAGNINAELNELDTIPVGVNKYTSVNNNTDTSTATKTELRQVAGTMTTPDISSPDLKKYYKETVFYDKSSDYLTMSYTTDAAKPIVKKIDVLIRQETSKLRSIFVEKLEERNDSTIKTRMVWTPGKSMQVITIAAKEGKENITTVKYVWGIE